MAIVVQCHQCSKILHLDDGFRGGVCRCGGCGTLLRVPKDAGEQKQTSRPDEPGKAAKQTDRPESPLQDPGLSRGTLTGQNAPRPPDPATSSGAFASSGARNRPTSPVSPNRPVPSTADSDALTGLEALAAMAPATSDGTKSGSGRPVPQPGVKSGRSGSLKSPGNTATKATKVPQAIPIAPERTGKSKPKSPPAIREALVVDTSRGSPLLLWIFIGAGIVFVIAVVIILIAVLHQSSGSSPGAKSLGGGSTGGSTFKVTQGGPRFLNIPLVGKRIIFSLDGSSANTNSFNLVADQVKLAVETLSGDQKFKIAIWRGDRLHLLPKAGWLTAGTARTSLSSLMNFTAYGSSDATICMPGSLKLGGDQIIFVTAKAILPNHITKLVAAARTHSQRIDTISVDGERKDLANIAQEDDGIFRMVSNSELQNLAGAQ